MAPRTFSATSGSERLGRWTIAGLVVVPLVVGGILSWALAAPTTQLDRVTAAIVNDDDPVTLNGQTVPLGREFAAGLIAGEAPSTDDAPPTPTTTPAPTGQADSAAAAGAAAPVKKRTASAWTTLVTSAKASPFVGTSSSPRSAVCSMAATNEPSSGSSIA